MAAQGVGSALAAKASNPKLTEVPPPTALFPELQGPFLSRIGQAGQGAIGTLQEFSATGAPTAVGPAFEALVQARERFTSQGRANLLEGFGAAGTRFSTSAREGLVDFESQVAKDFTALLEQMITASTEAARGRQLSASGLLSGQLENVATAMTPTHALTTGGASPAGAGLSSIGAGLQDLTLLRALGVIP